MGVFPVWGDNPFPPRHTRWIQGRRSVAFTVPEIHPLDARDEIEYVKARFEAVTVMAATRDALKGEGGNNENRIPQTARQMRNRLGSLAKVKITL